MGAEAPVSLPEVDREEEAAMMRAMGIPVGFDTTKVSACLAGRLVASLDGGLVG